MILPKKIVVKLIEKYEEYDIELCLNDSYVAKKKALLAKFVITHHDLFCFVENTKSIKFTYFLYDRWLVSFAIRNAFGPDIENKVIHDIKFKDMCYIKFRKFSSETVNTVASIIREAKQKQLILDLRNNIGGNLQSCLELLNMMVPEGEVLRIQTKNDFKYFYANGKAKKFEKIYVLINENTASCSEITSVVLYKKLDNVVLIGHKKSHKLYTQHVITNKLLGYSFSIADGIWYVDNEDASCLSKYLLAKNENWTELNDYLKFILLFREDKMHFSE
ncbi:S41 family peptidase [[Clostridium] polysaccharolyticum]|uniref:Peptidase family S41 n=1 Tax=[Clostridium] polysaccharolyticum TaxID=29364 RepID=A0A1I0BA30_9FIRM|nr:S41 family peptidase [[Clostridium] polysaccharolyticum]SET03390.1 Peptidase family S41 [[Clostridium] polysaccharolyticum]